MEKKIFFIFLLLWTKNVLNAQTPVGPNLQKLDATSSPAYFLLGVQPSNIQTPGTPRDFIGGIQSAIVNGQLQPNFAMEFNPINWFKSKQFANEFYANDYFYTKGSAIAKNLSISVATSSSDTVVFGKLKPGLGLGYGVKLSIFPGRVNMTITKSFLQWELEEARSAYIQALNSKVLEKGKLLSSQDIDSAFKAVILYLYSKKARSQSVYLLEENKAEISNALNGLASSYKNLASLEALRAKLQTDQASSMANKQKALNTINTNSKTMPYARVGFTLDLSFANANVFQQNQFQQSAYAKTAVWLTPAYTMDVSKETDNSLTQSLNFLGLVRYTWNSKLVDSGNYLDIGAKVQFNRNAWSASVEAVARNASVVPAGIHSNWTYSWLVGLNYTLNQSATLKFTFGSSFDGNTVVYTNPKQMFAVGGINLGIF